MDSLTIREILDQVLRGQIRIPAFQNVEEIMDHALCPKSLFEDNYRNFIAERSRILAERARLLCQLRPVVADAPMALGTRVAADPGQPAE
jgi:hypothetical protein